MTTLYTPLNQLATTVGVTYVASAGVLVVASGYGTTIADEITAEGAPAISAGNPVRISVVAAAHAADNPIAPADQTIYSVTGISGDILTIAGAIEGTTDRNYAIGDVVRFNATAGTVADLNDRVTTGWDLLSPLAASAVSVTGTASLSFETLHVCSGSTNYTATLPNPSGNGGKFLALVITSSTTAFVTLAPFGSEHIDGATSRLMWANESALLYCDGTNWMKLAGKSIPFATVIQRLLSNLSVGGSYTVLTMDSQLSGPSAMYDSVNGQALIVRGGNYNCIGSVYCTMSGSPPATAYLGISQNGGSNNVGQTGISRSDSTTVLGSLPTLFSFSAGDNVNLTIQTGGPSAVIAGPGAPTTIYLAEFISW